MDKDNPFQMGPDYVPHNEGDSIGKMLSKDFELHKNDSWAGRTKGNVGPYKANFDSIFGKQNIFKNLADKDG